MGPDSMQVDVHKFFCMNITKTCAYSFSWSLQENVLLVQAYILLVLPGSCAFFRLYKEQ